MSALTTRHYAEVLGENSCLAEREREKHRRDSAS